MAQKNNDLTKEEQLKLWTRKLQELEIGKNIMQPVLGMPAEHHIPYVKNMIQSVKEGKHIPYYFRTKENQILNRGKK